MPSTVPHQSLAAGRLCILLAAVLWSLSGLFTRLLQRPTSLGLHEPQLSALQIAFFRAIFAGLILVPLVRWRDIRFRPLMPPMIATFAIMNALFVSAMVHGPAANAILLQNIAPFFVFLVSVFLLGEKADRRSFFALLAGIVGMIVIVAGTADIGAKFEVTLMGVGSGISYGVIILCLRAMRNESPQWLIVQNHLGSAICLGTAVFLLNGLAFGIEWLTTPSWQQVGLMTVFGSVQMGLPYYLFARGLRSVSPQEAGAITLLEPLLNPLWAYLISPETDTPPQTTWIGGALILGALAYRYLPRRSGSVIA
jgi:drug/metabolite transporter (DMT)-like permease